MSEMPVSMEIATVPWVEEVRPYPDGSMVWAAKGLAEVQAELHLLAPKLPHNPLDDLIAQLGGPARVAELSGRSKRCMSLGGIPRGMPWGSPPGRPPRGLSWKIDFTLNA